GGPPGSSPGRRWSAGKPEDPFGDDVALDLGRAAGDGAEEAAQVALPPAGRVRLEGQRVDRGAAAGGGGGGVRVREGGGRAPPGRAGGRPGRPPSRTASGSTAPWPRCPGGPGRGC